MLKVLKKNFPHFLQVLYISKQLDFERKSVLLSGSAKSLVQILESFLEIVASVLSVCY